MTEASRPRAQWPMPKPLGSGRCRTAGLRSPVFGATPHSETERSFRALFATPLGEGDWDTGRVAPDRASSLDLRDVFRKLVEVLARDDAIADFDLVSHSMESPKGEDQRFHFVFAANGLPGKTAEVTLNLTKLLDYSQVRDQLARVVPVLALAIQENLEGGAYGYLAQGDKNVLMVEIGEGA